MSEAANKELPENWEWSTLGDVCEHPQYGWTTKASQEGDLHLLRTTDITSGQINWDTVPYCVEEPEDKEKYLIKDGDIVVSRAGSVGVSYLISNPEPSVFASYLIRFKPLIDRKYVYYFLKSPAYWNAISEKSAGIALQNVNASKLREIDIPVAPPEQQKRIVAKIEELFSHIDAGIEALKKGKQLLNQYRQSVLKAAVTGELTKEWREVNKDKLEPASQLLERILEARRQLWEEQQLEQFKAKGKMPKNDKWKEKYKEPEVSVDCQDLPEAWMLIPLDLVADVISGFAFKSKDFIEAGVPAVKIANVSYGEFVWKQQEYLPEVYLEKYKSFVILPKDILLALTRPITNNTVKACLYPDEAESALLNQRVCTIKNGKYLLKDYLLQVLQSEPFKQQINDGMSETLLPNLSPNDLKKFQFGLSSMEEQKEIVRLVEEKLGIANRLLAELEHHHVKAERNKQSILATAFSGRLQ